MKGTNFNYCNNVFKKKVQLSLTLMCIANYFILTNKLLFFKYFFVYFIQVMCLILNQNKNKINGIHTVSVESVDMVPETPESGAPEEEGNCNLKKYMCYSINCILDSE